MFAVVLVVEGMGDLNAVHRTHAGHVELLRKCDAMSENELLVRGKSFPGSDTIAIIYVDDKQVVNRLLKH